MVDRGPSLGLVTVFSTLVIMLCGGGVILTVQHPNASFITPYSGAPVRTAPES
jgi:hypothetical protein